MTRKLHLKLMPLEDLRATHEIVLAQYRQIKGWIENGNAPEEYKAELPDFLKWIKQDLLAVDTAIIHKEPLPDPFFDELEGRVITAEDLE